MESPVEAPATLDAMKPWERNPRKMEPASAKALAECILVFGDLSGILFNAETGNMVCAHQRRGELVGMQPSAIRWGEPFEVELGYSRSRFKGVERVGWLALPGGARFGCRLVRWSADFEAAANIAANNPKLQGEFTEQAAVILEELRATMPALMADELRFDDLLDELREAEGELDELSGGREQTIPTSWQVIVECADEGEQRKLFEEFTGRGLTVKLLIL